MAIKHNPLITILVGCPGSGKSTYTKDFPGIRISQDDQGKKGHMILFEEALKDRDNIIIDRMNFNTKQRNRYLDPAKKAGYDTEIVVFHVPMQDCLDRCNKRENHPTIKTQEVAEKAVSFFFKNYERVSDDEADDVIREGWVNEDDVKCIVSDLDGTLANVEHRRHYVKREKPLKKNWFMFFEKMTEDPVNEWCREILVSMKGKYPIVYVTGRPGNFEDYTETWLKENNLRFNESSLFMRLANDNRKDDIVKEIILEFEIKTRYNILMIIDDRKQVVEMWRKHGYTVLQCDPGDS